MSVLQVLHESTLTQITLNRPDKANALSGELVEALLAAVETAHHDGTRLLILDGAGKHFCAGFDFTGFEEQSEGDLALRFIRIETLLQALYHAPFATLALAHGRVFGAGADLVACCHTRIAAPDTTFRMPGLRFGVVLGTQRLAQRIGMQRAREILAESRTLDVQSAQASDFIQEIADIAQWPTVVDKARTRALALSAEAAAALYRQTTPDTRADDMSALAHSVSAPGLKTRIQHYRNQTH